MQFAGPMNVKFPGLNASIKPEETNLMQPISIVEQTTDEMKAKLDNVLTTLRTKSKVRKRFAREKLYPLERGFSGSRTVGQKLGPPPPVDGVTFDDFQTYCLEVSSRPARMVTFAGFWRQHFLCIYFFLD